jgi:hypothetical protein
MGFFWSKTIDEILGVGISLEGIGVRNFALTRQEALTALDQLARNKVPVLGGDVYLMKNGSIEPAYDNWYCDPQKEEAEIDFCNQSISRARDYIDKYKSAEDKAVFFAIVPKI